MVDRNSRMGDTGTEEFVVLKKLRKGEREYLLRGNEMSSHLLCKHHSRLPVTKMVCWRWRL